MNILNRLKAFYTTSAACIVLLAPSSAKSSQYGDFTYATTNSNVTITGYTGPGGTIIIPDKIDGMPVIQIGKEAFSQNKNITNIVIPDGVKNIASSAFYSCRSLIDAKIPNTVTNIGGGAFFNCLSLASINIPGSVTNISSSAFGYCSQLTNVTIADGVIAIGGTAFSCSGLSTVKIPSTVKKVGLQAFNSCTNLSWIAVDEANPVYSSSSGVLFDKTGAKLVQFPGALASYIIPNGVTNIEYGAFGGSAFLTNVVFPETLISIDDYAFSQCSALSSLNIPGNVKRIGAFSIQFCTNLTQVTFAEGVATLERDAFAYSGLTSVTIPSSITNIGYAAFWCASLTNISVSELNPYYSSIDGVLFNKNQTVLVQSPGAQVGTYRIPSTVTNIGDGAFCIGTHLTNLVVPSSVTRVGIWAFSNNKSLQNLLFEGDVPSIIEASAFQFNTTTMVYYRPETQGWTSTFATRPTMPWPSVSTQLSTNLVLTWPRGVLIETTNLVIGPWITNSTAQSPYTVDLIGPQKFYRLKLD